MASSAVHSLRIPSSSSSLAHGSLLLGLRSRNGFAAPSRQAAHQFRPLRVAALQDGDRDDAAFSGDEPPESLFMKELKRRGLAPPTKYSGASTETKTRPGEQVGDDPAYAQRSSKASSSSSSSPSSSSSASSSSSSTEDQLKRTRALNSEGLDGLIPRAQELLKLGATFFLAFWPLIIAIVALFVVIYLYFGPSFIHEGELHAGKPPPYVDPYQLLEEESLSKELAPSSYVQ